MAILNITPDSFSDGGKLATADDAVRTAEQFAAQGARVLDIGGESTRPGSTPVAAEEQLRRILPVVRAIRSRRSLDHVAISIDTTSGAVAEQTLLAGADAINDVSGMADDGEKMIGILRKSGAAYVLMHRRLPSPQESYSDGYSAAPAYTDVVGQIRDFLSAGLTRLESEGVSRERVVVDPGLGFGKTVDQCLQLIGRTPELLTLGRPVLSGLSRKSFVGRISLGRDSTPDERLPGTLSLSMDHFRAGARLFRVHDVAAHAEIFAISRPSGAMNPVDKSGI